MKKNLLNEVRIAGINEYICVLEVLIPRTIFTSTILAFPLANAWTASVREHCCSDIFQGCGYKVPFHGRADLL